MIYGIIMIGVCRRMMWADVVQLVKGVACTT